MLHDIRYDIIYILSLVDSFVTNAMANFIANIWTINNRIIDHSIFAIFFWFRYIIFSNHLRNYSLILPNIISNLLINNLLRV